jgi:hypothetical protein
MSFLPIRSIFFQADAMAALSCSLFNFWSSASPGAVDSLAELVCPLDRTDCGGFLAICCSRSSGRNTLVVVVIHILPGTSANFFTGGMGHVDNLGHEEARAVVALCS